ncbi:DNA polymerase III subunit delta [Sandaracinus amylolyticus]|uniref:DNA polymerase III subunit delta n=1 Tax=Sandaracinus amylolyticus TaxID=927083 RepID=A0A0F6W0X4_9BACT|nr:DNA polymerase III subunit delta [Sandaracinus amylolyticus]AKF04675.1 DNA polymerase III delta subunit [Sandaracinus amylolyticus]
MSEERDIQSLLGDARAGKWQPIVLLVGSERFLAERAAKLLKKAVVGDGPSGFNDDLFHGAQVVASRVVGTAKTLPMMAKARYVLIRDAEDVPAAELDALAAYVAAPSPSTCLVMIAEKIDGRSKLSKAAKSAGAWIECEPLKGPLLERFVLGEAKRRGHTISPDAGQALLDALGNDLAAIDDAVERLSLYVGKGAPIDLAAVEASIVRIRVDSIWTVVDAVAARKSAVALEAVGSLLADREPPLRILAMVARQLRMVAKAKQALADGLRGPEMARFAGALPFKARDLEAAARKFDDDALRAAFRALAEADLALKGSKRPPEVVMEEVILALCSGRDLPLVSEWQFRV